MQSSSEIMAYIIPGDGGASVRLKPQKVAPVCATNYTNRLHALISIKTPVFSEGGIVGWLQQDRPLCVGKSGLPSP
jgi:hypothetical protein